MVVITFTRHASKYFKRDQVDLCCRPLKPDDDVKKKNPQTTTSQ